MFPVEGKVNVVVVLTTPVIEAEAVVSTLAPATLIEEVAFITPTLKLYCVEEAIQLLVLEAKRPPSLKIKPPKW